MAFFLPFLTKRGTLVLSGAGLVLIGFIGFLIASNFQSHRRVHEFALARLIQDTEQHATALTYYLSETKEDIETLAASRSILTFFENKALGMSMEYGLGTSLLDMSVAFDQVLEKARIQHERIFTRIVFIDTNGHLLVDTGTGTEGKEGPGHWKRFLRSENGGPTLTVARERPIEILVSTPYLFKGQYMGQIVAWISPGTIYGVMTARVHPGRWVYVACHLGNLLLNKGISFEAPLSSLPKSTALTPGKIYRFDGRQANGSKIETIVVRVPVEGTPLNVFSVVPASEIGEGIAFWYLPLGMGFLGILILVGTGIAYRINTQKLVLHAQLEEASKGRKGIEAKNRQLSGEIGERRKAEAAAHIEASVNMALAEVSNAILLSPSIKDLSSAVLEPVRRLTGSRFGYAGYVDPKTGFFVSPTLTREVWDQCQVQDRDVVFKEFTGLWGWVLDNRQPLFTNTPRDDPRFSGTPEGHIVIDRFLSVPALFENRLLGQIALANPDRNYTEEDLVLAERFAALYAIGIQRIRDEASLKEINLELEDRVARRTAALTKVVEGLRREVEERKQVEEKLKTSETRTRRIIEASPVGICIHQRGRYLYVNPAFVKTFGYAHPDEILGREVESLILPEDRELVRGRWKGRLAGDNPPESYNVRGLKKEGGRFEAAVWATGIEYEDGPAILVFVIDMSAERELRLQLQESQKMEALGTLAGGIAHDFNNILSAIIGYTDLAKMKLPKESDLIPDLDEVRKAGNRAKNLIRQVLTVSRQTAEERRPIRPIYIVKEALKLLRASVPSSIQFDERIEKDTGAISADTTRIHQIVMNLCTNAQHAMQNEGGTLTVCLGNVEVDSRGAQVMGSDPGPYIRLTVGDTGCGMPPEVVERVFEPYYTTKEKGEGTGLGLAVVHGIIESYGGKITVYSEPGKGTTFHVYFRRIDTASTNEQRPAEGLALPAGSERILFVDDEATLTHLGKRMLERLGYEVTALTSSTEALDRFCEDPDRFDLVITDLTMPEMTGDRLTEKMMEIRPGMPIIICSGFVEKLVRQKAQKMGARAFIEKPLASDVLAQTVREVLDA